MVRRSTPVLILDLDGTVRHGKAELGRFVNGPDDVVVFPEALARMREWKAAMGRIVGVSNQGGVALGHLSERNCRDAMGRTAELADGLFDVIVWCPHHPAATDPEQAQCWARKPRPGLLIEAVLELSEAHPDEFYPPDRALMVGDRPEDEQCAARAGVAFMHADQWRVSGEG